MSAFWVSFRRTVTIRPRSWEMSAAYSSIVRADGGPLTPVTWVFLVMSSMMLMMSGRSPSERPWNLFEAAVWNWRRNVCWRAFR